MRKIVLFILLAVSLWDHPGKAQNLNDTIRIREVSVFARQIQVKEEAGSVRSEVDSIAMVQSMEVSLSELIGENTPVFIKTYGRGAMATVNFRGTAPSHTKVQWNGITLNSPMLGMVDFSTIPVYFIDDAALLHGSSSLSETSGALGGSVQLKNNTNWNNTFSGQLLSGVGSYSSYDAFGKINLGNHRIQSSTRMFFKNSANDFEIENRFIADIDPETGAYIYPRQRNEDAEYENYGLLQELSLRANERNIISARYWYQHNDRSIPRLMTQESEENANLNRQTDKTHRGILEWNSYGTKGKLKVSSGISHQIMGYTLQTVVNGAPSGLDSDSKATAWSFFNKISYHYNLSGQLSLTTGIDADYHEVESVDRAITNAGYEANRKETSLFLQVSHQLSDRLTASLISRQNYYDNKAAPFIPSLGAEFKLLRDKELYIKANVARNYHQPTLNALYFIPGGNPDLKPEEGYTADAGLSFSSGRGNLLLQSSLNGYLSAIDNWIIWLPTTKGYWEPSNMKSVSSKGVEFSTSVRGKFRAWEYRFTANYALTQSINKDESGNWADESYGKQLPYIPVHSANIMAHLDGFGFHASYQWNYYSKRYTTSSNTKDMPQSSLYPYFMNNLFVGKTFEMEASKLNVELKIYNLLNETYRTVLQRMMPKRNYAILVRFDF